MPSRRKKVVVTKDADDNSKTWTLSPLDHVPFVQVVTNPRKPLAMETKPYFHDDEEINQRTMDHFPVKIVIEGIEMVKANKRSLKTQYTKDLKGRRPRKANSKRSKNNTVVVDFADGSVDATIQQGNLDGEGPSSLGAVFSSARQALFADQDSGQKETSIYDVGIMDADSAQNYEWDTEDDSMGPVMPTPVARKKSSSSNNNNTSSRSMYAGGSTASLGSEGVGSASAVSALTHTSIYSRRSQDVSIYSQRSRHSHRSQYSGSVSALSMGSGIPNTIGGDRKYRKGDIKKELFDPAEEQNRAELVSGRMRYMEERLRKLQAAASTDGSVSSYRSAGSSSYRSVGSLNVRILPSFPPPSGTETPPRTADMTREDPLTITPHHSSSYLNGNSGKMKGVGGTKRNGSGGSPDFTGETMEESKSTDDDDYDDDDDSQTDQMLLNLANAVTTLRRSISPQTVPDPRAASQSSLASDGDKLYPTTSSEYSRSSSRPREPIAPYDKQHKKHVSEMEIVIGRDREASYTGLVLIMGENEQLVPHAKEGHIEFDNGDTYDGPISHGAMQGSKATYQWAQGDVYKGEFHQNMRHGEGEYTTVHKRKYVGRYVKDRPHGSGTLYNADGTVFHEGEWFNGKPIRKKGPDVIPNTPRTTQPPTTTTITPLPRDNDITPRASSSRKTLTQVMPKDAGAPPATPSLLARKPPPTTHSSVQSSLYQVIADDDSEDSVYTSEEEDEWKPMPETPSSYRSRRGLMGMN